MAYYSFVVAATVLFKFEGEISSVTTEDAVALANAAFEGKSIDDIYWNSDDREYVGPAFLHSVTRDGDYDGDDVVVFSAAKDAPSGDLVEFVKELADQGNERARELTGWKAPDPVADFVAELKRLAQQGDTYAIGRFISDNATVAVGVLDRI